MTLPILILLFLLSLPAPLESFFQKGSAPPVDQGSSRKTSLSLNEQSLLESGQATKLRRGPATSDEIKIVSYNIRWRSGDELRELVKLFRDDPEIGNAAIIGLQEVDRSKKRSKNTNTVKLIAEELGFYYAWTSPPTAKSGAEEETGVAVLSLYPLSDIRRIVLPHKGPGGRRRVALGATVRVAEVDWRVYSIHAETRMAFDKKLEQMDAVLQDLAQYPARMPAIVLGDLNTWEPGAGRKVIRLFSDAGLQTPFDGQATFLQRVLFVPIKLRLDWVWLRAFEICGYGIDRKIDISDHWPLWVKVKPLAEKK